MGDDGYALELDSGEQLYKIKSSLQSTGLYFLKLQGLLYGIWTQ
jgi:hypothetical protein